MTNCRAIGIEYSYDVDEQREASDILRGKLNVDFQKSVGHLLTEVQTGGMSLTEALKIAYRAGWMQRDRMSDEATGICKDAGWNSQIFVDDEGPDYD